jgi:hypothetical protein
MTWLPIVIWLVMMLAVIVSRSPRLDRKRPEPVAHRPDYAKIARLEVELGLVEPPRYVPERKAAPGSIGEEVQRELARINQYDPDGFGYRTGGVRSRPEK